MPSNENRSHTGPLYPDGNNFPSEEKSSELNNNSEISQDNESTSKNESTFSEGNYYPLQSKSLEITYHCYDCGGVWDKKGVDIIQNKDSVKYVCKECRGRCIPKNELGKKRGVKSVRQRFSNRWIIIVLIIFVSAGVAYKFYDQRVTINDYRNYLAESAKMRKEISPHLVSFRDDYKLIEQSKKIKVDPQKLKSANIRFYNAKRFILRKSDEIDEIEKPEKPEILELYNLETGFWKNPNYLGYITYTAVFNKLEQKYGHDFFAFIKDKVKARLEKRRKKQAVS